MAKVQSQRWLSSPEVTSPRLTKALLVSNMTNLFIDEDRDSRSSRQELTTAQAIKFMVFEVGAMTSLKIGKVKAMFGLRIGQISAPHRSETRRSLQSGDLARPAILLRVGATRVRSSRIVPDEVSSVEAGGEMRPNEGRYQSSLVVGFHLNAQVGDRMIIVVNEELVRSPPIYDGRFLR